MTEEQTPENAEGLHKITATEQALIEQNPWWIGAFPKATDEQKIFAIKKNPNVLAVIQRPTLEMIELAQQLYRERTGKKEDPDSIVLHNLLFDAYNNDS